MSNVRTLQTLEKSKAAKDSSSKPKPDKGKGKVGPITKEQKDQAALVMKDILKLTDQAQCDVLTDDIVTDLIALKGKIALHPKKKKQNTLSASQAEVATGAGFTMYQAFQSKYSALKRQISDEVVAAIRGAEFNLALERRAENTAELVEQIRRVAGCVKVGSTHFRMMLMDLLDKVFYLRKNFITAMKRDGHAETEKSWRAYYAVHFAHIGYEWYA